MNPITILGRLMLIIGYPFVLLMWLGRDEEYREQWPTFRDFHNDWVEHFKQI